jgi:hypothetical protein
MPYRRPSVCPETKKGDSGRLSIRVPPPTPGHHRPPPQDLTHGTAITIDQDESSLAVEKELGNSERADELDYLALLARNRERAVWERVALGKTFQAAFGDAFWDEIKLG